MLSICFGKKSIASESGFTLIEVMVALAIFVIAIIGCYRLQVASSYSNAKANSVATAASWAQYTAEDLLARKYSAAYTDPLLEDTNGNGAGGIGAYVVGTSDGLQYVGSDGSVSAVAASPDYSIFWNIADNSPLNNIKQIRVIVVKNSGLNKGRLYTQDYFDLGPI